MQQNMFQSFLSNPQGQEYGGNGSAGKESACNSGDTGDLGLIPGSGRSPGEGKSNPSQYSCLGNLMDRGVWRATVHGVTKETQIKD